MLLKQLAGDILVTTHSENKMPQVRVVRPVRRVVSFGVIAAVGFTLVSLTVLTGCEQSQRRAWFRPKQPRHVQTNLYGEFDGWKPRQFEAKPFTSLSQHSFCEEGGDFDPDISPDGKWVAISSMRHSPNPDLYIKKIHGSTATRLTSDPASEMHPCFSPNGDRVAYTSNRSGSWDIWVVGVDGTNSTRLTTSSSNDVHPSWSPDGKQLVYSSYGGRSEQWELWVLEVENPSTKQWIGYGLYPQWCPEKDNPKIAFQLARHRGSKWFSVWTVDYVDGEAKFPTEIATSVHHACIGPSWMPDGETLVYSTVGRSFYEKTKEPVPDNSGQDVYMVSLDGTNSLRLTNGDASNFSPTCGPQGRVYFCSDRSGTNNIWSIKPHQIDFAMEKPVDLSSHPQSGFLAN